MKVILIDNYDSFTYNLAHLISSANNGILPLVYRNDEITIEEVLNHNPVCVFISPGPSHPKNSGICVNLVLALAEKSIPVFGVCLGFQVIAQAYGGSVIESNNPSHGVIDYIDHNQKGIFKKLMNPLKIVRYHSLIVDKKSLPACFGIDAKTSNNQQADMYKNNTHKNEKQDIIMAIHHKTKPIYGVLFHPESYEAKEGSEIISNFFNLLVTNNKSHRI